MINILIRSKGFNILIFIQNVSWIIQVSALKMNLIKKLLYLLTIFIKLSFIIDAIEICVSESLISRLPFENSLGFVGLPDVELTSCIW